jgi:hypothetical protein
MRHASADENTAVAEGDFVFVQGRFSNIGAPSALITVDMPDYRQLMSRNRQASRRSLR